MTTPTPTPKKKRPRYYFCFRSPFSWIASKVFNARLTEMEQNDLEYRPFWEPDEKTMAAVKAQGGEFLYTTMSREKHLYILQDIKRLTKSLGYEHVWPIDENPWWELPNLAWFAAERAGKGREFRDAVFKSRWEDGENVHTIDVVRKLADKVGLDPNKIANAPEDPEIRAAAVEAIMRCHKDGVFGVPFFIKGFEKFWGVDRLEPFLAAWRQSPFEFLDAEDAKWKDEDHQIWENIPRALVRNVGGSDKDSAGGCG
jgi:2-hydroxychromene-2-carboxylate isomerase